MGTAQFLPSVFAVGLAATCCLAAGGQAGAATTDPAPVASAAVADDPFPITVEHAFGETVIERAPERIVSVGYTEHDTLLALGIVPVGLTEWYGDWEAGVWPWALEALGDERPVVLQQVDGFQLERIAALDPDLIVGVNAGVDADTYEQLSEIAPTVAQPEGSTAWFGPWDQLTLQIGRAVGREADAQALIGGIDERFAEARAAHPEFEGTSVVFLQNTYYDGEAIAYQGGLSTKFLTDLGFTVPSSLDEFVGPDSGSQAYIPLERLGVLDDADLLIWATESEGDVDTLRSAPLYETLTAVREGREVFTNGLLAGAIYFTSPLSLGVVVDELVPAAAAALAGDGPVSVSVPEA